MKKKHKLNIVDNLFNVCNQKKIKTDFKKQKSDLILTQTKKKESLYLAYSPLKINDWMVGYIVSVHAAQESYTFIIHYETLVIRN